MSCHLSSFFFMRCYTLCSIFPIHCDTAESSSWFMLPLWKCEWKSFLFSFTLLGFNQVLFFLSKHVTFSTLKQTGMYVSVFTSYLLCFRSEVVFFMLFCHVGACVSLFYFLFCFFLYFHCVLHLFVCWKRKGLSWMKEKEIKISC